MNPAAARAGSLALVAMALAGCRAPAPPTVPPAPSPTDACRAVSDSLAAAVLPGQSLAELQARGIRVRTPIAFPPGSMPAAGPPAGAAVQAMISADGEVVPGSPRTLKSIGDPQLARALEAGALSMRFDFDAGAKPTTPVPFVATFAACARS